MCQTGFDGGKWFFEPLTLTQRCGATTSKLPLDLLPVPSETRCSLSFGMACLVVCTDAGLEIEDFIEGS